MNKAILVGLDGASFNIIDPWIEDGSLPTFARLKKDGVHGVLKSTIPSSTVPGWAAMLTGKSPGKLGYCDLSQRIPGSYRIGPTDFRWDAMNPVWHIASDQGRRVCVINVPTTAVPTRSLNGIFIAGRGPLATDRQLAVPDRIQKRLEEIGYRDSVALPPGLVGPELMEHLTAIATQQCQLALELLVEENWDFYAFCLFVTDLANHICLGEEIPGYQYPERARQDLLRIYQIADRYLGRLLEAMPEGCNVTIASDHGQTTNRWIIDLNQWLLDQGLLRTKQARNVRWTRQRLLRILRDTGLLPWYKRLTSGKLMRRADQAVRGRVPLENIGSHVTDWSATQAYSINKQGIFVNLEGREPRGMVSAGEYEGVRQRLIDGLNDLRDPETGEKIVQEVWRREEVYSGPYLEKMPDIAIEWRWGYENRITEGQPTGTLFKRPDRRYTGGVHTRDGLFMAYGPDIQPNGDLRVVQILDVAPTLTHLLGLLVPDDIDGQVSLRTLRPLPRLQEVRRMRPTQPVVSEERRYSQREEAAIKKRLKDLGYMD